MLALTLNAVTPGLVIVMLEAKLNVPLDPLSISTRAPPLSAFVALLKLYVPSALSNCRPVPRVAVTAPLNVSVPLVWLPVMLMAAALLACVILPP